MPQEFTLQPSPVPNRAKLHDTVPGGVRTFTFVPTIQFGTGTTGITYGVQLGSVTIIGNRLSFEISITLTSKGTSTGDAMVVGPPFAVNGVSPACPVLWDAMASSLVHVVGIGGQGTPDIGIQILGITAGATSILTVLQDTDFTDTSTINISGSYFVFDNAPVVV